MVVILKAKNNVNASIWFVMFIIRSKITARILRAIKPTFRPNKPAGMNNSYCSRIRGFIEGSQHAPCAELKLHKPMHQVRLFGFRSAG